MLITEIIKITPVEEGGNGVRVLEEYVESHKADARVQELNTMYPVSEFSMGYTFEGVLVIQNSTGKIRAVTMDVEQAKGWLHLMGEVEGECSASHTIKS